MIRQPFLLVADINNEFSVLHKYLYFNWARYVAALCLGGAVTLSNCLQKMAFGRLNAASFIEMLLLQYVVKDDMMKRKNWSHPGELRQAIRYLCLWCFVFGALLFNSEFFGIVLGFSSQSIIIDKQSKRWFHIWWHWMMSHWWRRKQLKHDPLHLFSMKTGNCLMNSWPNAPSLCWTSL